MSEEAYAEEPIGIPDFLRDPVGMLRRRWAWMVTLLTVGVLATGIFVARIEPTYESTATILIASQRIPEEFVRPTVEEDSLQQISAMVGQVLTRATLSELIERFGLYRELWDAVPREELVARLRGNIQVQPEAGITRSRNETARLIAVSFEDRDPQTAAEVANEIAGLFTAENLKRRSKQARMTTDFLQRELVEAEAALREQEREITEFKERHRGELPGDLNTNLGRLERLQQQRQSLALQIAESSNRITLLSSDESPDARLASLRAELSARRGVLTDRHPDVLALQEQIRSLEAELRDTPASERTAGTPAGTMLAAEQATLTSLRRQLLETERELSELDLRVARTPKREEELAALAQRASVLRDSYLEFLRKVNEAELAESLEAAQHGARFSILDRAVPATSPARSSLKYAVAGLVASLGLAVGFGVFLELIDPVLFDAGQIERLTELPVLGSVPHIS